MEKFEADPLYLAKNECIFSSHLNLPNVSELLKTATNNFGLIEILTFQAVLLCYVVLQCLAWQEFIMQSSPLSQGKYRKDCRVLVVFLSTETIFRF